MADARLALLVAALVLAAACNGVPPEPPSATAAGGAQPTALPTSAPPTVLPRNDEPSPLPASPTASPTEAGPADAELAALGVNELGRVLVVEWHEIQDRDGRWSNSLVTFRRQLQELYDRGYRPISLGEFIDGTFPIPAGTSPVLLTFDDSYHEHLFFADDGTTPHPDSVVGILEDMQRRDPEWRARAVFAFYWPAPFREYDPDVITRKLRYLVDNGFDLSNHSETHDDLSAMTDAEVARSLANAERRLNELVDHRLRSLTLPFGKWPATRDLALSGEHDGWRYDHEIVLQVGFMPTRSPHHAAYDPLDVQRVQAYLPEFEKWVAWLDAAPGRRFVSDGDPTTVTYPSSFDEVAAPLNGFATRVYAGGEP